MSLDREAFELERVRAWEALGIEHLPGAEEAHAVGFCDGAKYGAVLGSDEVRRLFDSKPLWWRLLAAFTGISSKRIS